MSVLPTPSQIAGKHYQLYDAYYNQLPKNPDGSIAAMEGAKFLKRSGLSDAILSKIWDMSDPQAKGYLDKSGLFLSIKLITLAQTGKDVNMPNAGKDLDDLPEMSGEKPVVRPPSRPSISPLPPHLEIAEDMIANFQKMFLTVAEPSPNPGQPMCVPGAKAKGMMIESQLPIDILGKIWDMADTNKDGALDEPEFIIALHLVQTAKKGQPLPPSLPPDFINTVRRGLKTSPMAPRRASLISQESLQSSPTKSSPSMVPVMPPPPSSVPILPPVSMPPQPVVSAPLVTSAAPPSSQGSTSSDGWIITPDERIKFGNLFLQTDKDHDGYISGAEIKDLFLQSGVPQAILAHIWNLCDDQQQGKLGRDQFILAMWFIHRKVTMGVDPPHNLTPEMIIPERRAGGGANNKESEELNPEFELILKEIRELSNEKSHLECEILSKESEKKVKTGELKSLQSEYDTLAATLKQLENQKNVAKTKLADLETQVTSLRSQAEQQESTLVEQETELSQKRHELTSLDTELVDNEKEQKEIHNKMEQLGDLTQQTQLKISKLRTQINDLSELENTMRSCLIKYDDCIENNNYLAGVVETDLRDLGLEFEEICDAYTEIKTPNTKEVPSFQEAFGGEIDHGKGDAFGETGFEAHFDSSPFEAQFEETPAASYNDDPFAALRPETAPAWPANKPHDPFAPVSVAAAPKSPAGFEKDPFGSEPFSAAPGPAPNLPPKKPPPPRPAPPKGAPARPPPPKTGPSPAPSAASASSDPFGGESGGGFADFANFDSAGFFSSTAPSASSSSRSSKVSKQSPWGSDFSHSFSTSTLPTSHHHSSSSSKSRSRNQNSGTTARSASNLDFTEDPFKNYRYEDPFALSVDPFLNNNNANNNTRNNNNTTLNNNNFDPFK